MVGVLGHGKLHGEKVLPVDYVYPPGV